MGEAPSPKDSSSHTTLLGMTEIYFLFSAIGPMKALILIYRIGGRCVGRGGRNMVWGNP